MESLSPFAAARRRWSLLLATLAAAPVLSAPVGDASQRAALMIRQPQRAVLLAGAVAGQRLVVVGERGVVALSDDRGKTWRQAKVPVSVTLTSVRFADERHGMAVGHGGTVLASGDGGETWSLRLDGHRAAQIALDSARAQGDPKLLKGAELLVADGPDKPFLDVMMLDSSRAVVVGAYGLALATDDGGASWSSWMPRLDNPKSMHLYGIRRDRDVLAIVGEQGVVLRSNDGGRTFRRVALPYKGSLFCVELLSDGAMLVAGLRGNVWRSEGRDESWAQVANPMPVSITSMAQRRDGGLLLANQAGFVFELKSGLIVPLNAVPLPPINGMLVEPGSSDLLALTVQGVVPVSAAGAPGAFK